MNHQPFQKPPRRWESQLSPRWVQMLRPWRARTLRNSQRITRIEVTGIEPLRGLLRQNAGVLLTPNHSFHYDSYVLFEATDRVGTAVHVLTAWQVFAMSTWFECWSLQKHGCFSIDREGVDIQAFKTAVEILKERPQPLVIFPEGDIYHTNERVTPFREGAATIALSAAKRAARPVFAVPTAIKAWYVSDPLPRLLELMETLERRLWWQPQPNLPLVERVLRFAGGMLSLKELEHLGAAQPGDFPERVQRLSDAILKRQETRAGLTPRSTLPPERVKELRKRHIEQLAASELAESERQRLEAEMAELFFVVQLFSYPGDYLRERPTIERIAETLDKFEEDVLGAPYPAVRGERHAAVSFGEPILVPAQAERDAGERLTARLEANVQEMLTQMRCPELRSGA